jgi:Fic family protein
MGSGIEDYLESQCLSGLRRIATIESIGSSTRIEGAQLSDAAVDRLLSRVEITSFGNRDEQEVLGYADAMELVFGAWSELSLTENHIKQLHATLLQRSERDERHRGEYKKLSMTWWPGTKRVAPSRPSSRPLRPSTPHG